MANSVEDSSLIVRLHAVQEQYGALHEALSALLFARDPVHLSMGWNTDEYQFEVMEILERIHAIHGATELASLILEIFRKNFGGGDEVQDADEDESVPGVAAISVLAVELWRLYREYVGDRKPSR